MDADGDASVGVEGEDVAAVGNVRDAFIKALRDQLKVDSNLLPPRGGTALYRKAQSLSLKLLEKLDPSDEKEKALQIARRMDVVFESKLNTTWRPFVILQLEIFGEPVEGYLKAHRLDMKDFEWAKRVADQLAAGEKPDPRPLKRPRPSKKNPAVLAIKNGDGAIPKAEISGVVGGGTSSGSSNRVSVLGVLAGGTSSSSSNGVSVPGVVSGGSASSSSKTPKVEGWEASLTAATKEQEKKTKKNVSDMVKLERLAARVARTEAADTRARHEAGLKIKEIAARIGVKAEFQTKEEETVKKQRQEDLDTSDQALEVAAKTFDRKAKRSRRGETSAKGERLDGFFKAKSEKEVKKEASKAKSDAHLKKETPDGLPGNSNPSSSSSSVCLDPKGYYATLEVAPSSTYADIKAAYRRLILKHHPDKGGSTAAFRDVQEAYEFLSDDSERAKYDSGRTAPTAAEGSRTDSTDIDQANAEVLQIRAAKAVFARMMTTPKADWEDVLAGTDAEILRVLKSLCEKNSLFVEGRPESQSKRKRDEEEDRPGEFAGKGLWRVGAGWKVQVAWRTFKIISLKVIKDLEEAINLHIALVDIRRSAKSRHKVFLSHLKNMGINVDKLKCDFDDCAVMTHDEWLKLIREEPFVQVNYCTDIGKTASTVRVQVPLTPSFQSAIEFRALARRCLQYGGDVPTAKERMFLQAKKDREEHAQQLKDAVAMISQESTRRTIKDNAARNAIVDEATRRAVEEITKQNLLCLKETSAEEEIASIKAAMEDEKKQMQEQMQQQMQAFVTREMQSLKDQMEADKENQKQSMEVQLQSIQRQVEEERKVAEEERKVAEEERKVAEEERKARLEAEEEMRRTKARMVEEEQTRRAQAAIYPLVNNRNVFARKDKDSEEERKQRVVQEAMRVAERENMNIRQRTKSSLKLR